MSPVVRRTLQVGLTGLVTFFILRRIGVSWSDLQALEPSAWSIDLPLFVLSAVLMVCGYAVSGWLWARLVGELGGPHLPIVAAMRIYMVANLGRYVPGKVLQLVGLTVLARRAGVPTSIALSAAVLGHAVALLGAGLVGVHALLGAGAGSMMRLLGWVVLGATLLLITLTSIPSSAAVLQRAWLRLARVPPPMERGAAGALSVPTRLRGFGLRWSLAYGVNWLIYAAAFALLARAMVGPVDPWITMSAFAAAYVSGYLALFAPAGLGIREAALVGFLAPVLLPDAALALAVVARLWSTLLEVVPAALLALTGGPAGAHEDLTSAPEAADV